MLLNSNLNFPDGKNIQFMNCILSRPTLSIAVTETIVKAQGSLWWDTEMMEVESESHQGQTILLSVHTTSTKVPTVTIIYLWHYNRYFTSLSLMVTVHTLPWTVDKTLDVKFSSHLERLHYGKMAAVSVRRMCTGSYAHLIALIIFCIP